MSIASTVDQSSSSMKGKLPIPGCAGCNPASQTTFFPLCSMTQHDLPTSCPAPSIVIVKGGVSSSPLWTWTGAERWSCRRGCRRMAPRHQVCYLFCRVQGESRMEGWTTIDPEFSGGGGWGCPSNRKSFILLLPSIPLNLSCRCK